MSIRGLITRFHSEGVLSMNELMDSAEVGDFLALSPRTVRRRTAEGTLPGSRRIGTAVRWSRSILRAWVLAGCPDDAEAFEVSLQRWIPKVVAGLTSPEMTAIDRD